MLLRKLQNNYIVLYYKYNKKKKYSFCYFIEKLTLSYISLKKKENYKFKNIRYSLKQYDLLN